MTRTGGYYDGYPDDKCCEPARAALEAMGSKRYTCSVCPFPFCIVLEHRKLNSLARSYIAASMVRLGDSASIVAARLGVSASWVRKSCKGNVRCYWCSVDKVQANVFCRSNLCTVAPLEGQVVVVLSHHRKATALEERRVSEIVESMFPEGVLVRPGENGGEHDHWTVSNLLSGEPDRVFSRMSKLSKYAPTLRGVS